MANKVSKKETRLKVRESILKATEEITVHPASKRLKKAVKTASKKIGKELVKDLRKFSKKASKMLKGKGKKKKAEEPVAVGS